jgi:CBS domain containing-hemolysin-like protein
MPTAPPDTMSDTEGSSSDTAPHRAPRPRDDGFLERLLGLFGLAKPVTARDELEEALESEVPAATGFTPREEALLRNILDMGGRRVEDIMVPRSDVVAVSNEISLGELLDIFAGAAHSRLVVHSGTLDEPVGMVHIRDLMAFLTNSARAAEGHVTLGKVNLETRLIDTGIGRRVLYVPPSMPILDLLAKMQQTRIHLALVIDEYGGTDGLLSIEDIVEQVVGNIEDEHDDEEDPAIVSEGPGQVLADGRAALDDVAQAVGQDLAFGDLSEEVDTIGGYVVAVAGRVPAPGEVVEGPEGFDIEVVEADPRRINRLRIRRRSTAAAA